MTLQTPTKASSKRRIMGFTELKRIEACLKDALEPIDSNGSAEGVYQFKDGQSFATVAAAAGPSITPAHAQRSAKQFSDWLTVIMARPKAKAPPSNERMRLLEERLQRVETDMSGVMHLLSQFMEQWDDFKGRHPEAEPEPEEEMSDEPRYPPSAEPHDWTDEAPILAAVTNRGRKVV